MFAAKRGKEELKEGRAALSGNLFGVQRSGTTCRRPDFVAGLALCWFVQTLHV